MDKGNNTTEPVNNHPYQTVGDRYRQNYCDLYPQSRKSHGKTLASIAYGLTAMAMVSFLILTH